MRRTYRFAEKNVEISSLHNEVHSLCKDYITDKPCDFMVETTQKDIEIERQKAVDEAKKEGIAVTEYFDSYLETLAVYREIAEQMIDYNTILFHGSAIAVDGQAYLFTAKSGTGKSTHTRLWREYFGKRAFMVNDDKPLIMINENGAFVCGTPWNGKHRLGTNTIVPLKAVCVLSRAEQNSIVRLDKLKALPFLFGQTYKSTNKKKFIKTLDLLEAMANKVEFYHLKCNMEKEAAEVSYNGMNEI